MTHRSRAMALAAILAGDYELLGLSCSATSLAESAREAAEVVLAGTHEELSQRIAAEMAALLENAPAGELQEGWSRVPTTQISPPGLRRLVQVIALPEWPPVLPTMANSILAEAEPGPLLAELSQVLLQRAAGGKRWALQVMTRAAEFPARSSVSVRLIPAVVWICAAYAHEEVILDGLASAWPAELRLLLRNVQNVFSRGHDELMMNFDDSLREELEGELSRRG